jgi:hypothetical protein
MDVMQEHEQHGESAQHIDAGEAGLFHLPGNPAPVRKFSAF